MRTPLNRLLRLLRQLSHDDGFTIALTALMLVPLMAFTALAVDLGAWYARASQIQRAADAASLAGVEALPRGDGAATAAALRVAADNGFVHGEDDVTVVVEPLPPDQVRVTIRDASVTQYFTSIFRDPTDNPVIIERSSLAEYVPPVRMGSPRNFLGTWYGSGTGGNSRVSDGIPTAAWERFWLSISSPCSPMEDGDLRQATHRVQFSGSSFNGCNTGQSNDEFYRERGYLYGIKVPDDWNGGQLNIQVFDAPYCAGVTPTNDLVSSSSSFTTRYTIYREGFESSPIRTLTLQGKGSGQSVNSSNPCHSNHSPRWHDRWQNLTPAFTPVPGATYIVQVQAPRGLHSGNGRGPANNFALRAYGSNTGWRACTTDDRDRSTVAWPSVPESRCPQVFAYEDLSVYTLFQGGPGGSLQSISWFLASIGPEHSGKTLQIELFDPGEGASYIEVLNPLGQSHPFTWQVRRQLASEGTPGGPGWGPGVITGPPGLPLNPSTGEPQVGPNRSSNRYRYNERVLQLRVQLPENMSNPPSHPTHPGFGNSTWWKIQYTGGSQASNDRTTWTVTVFGDPVRLIR